MSPSGLGQLLEVGLLEFVVSEQQFAVLVVGVAAALVAVVADQWVD